MGSKGKKLWWPRLLTARKLAGTGGSITAASFAAATGDSLPIAAAWLGKFVGWGYAVLAGTTTRPGAGRWVRVWALTKYGLTRLPPVGELPRYKAK